MSIELKQLDTDEILRYMAVPRTRPERTCRTRPSSVAGTYARRPGSAGPGAVTIYFRRRTACVCPAACSSPAGT